MLLTDVFDERSLVLGMEGKTKEEAFRELVGAIMAAHPDFDRETMLQAVLARENKMNTAIGPGVAVPHGCYPGTHLIIGAIGISRNGVDYDAPDHKPVHCVFLMLMGDGGREHHLPILNRIMSLVNSESIYHLREATSPKDVRVILSRVH